MSSAWQADSLPLSHPGYLGAPILPAYILVTVVSYCIDPLLCNVHLSPLLQSVFSLNLGRLQ